jgi:Flp pilus assembly CpaF family ATPase
VTVKTSALAVFLGDETVRLLLEDSTVTEIYTNDDLQLRVDGLNGRQALPHTYAAQNLIAFFRKMATSADIPLDEENPIADFELPPELGGGRLHVTIPPVTKRPNFNLRKPSSRRYRLADLVENDTLSTSQADYLISAIRFGRTVLVAGPTNSGKTTLLNALLEAAVSTLDPTTRFLIIEDVPELRCPAPDTKYSRTSPNVTLWDLVRATMRSSPDRIVVGELRGKEAYPFLDLAASGHGGVLASIHAETPLGALNRLNRLSRLGGDDVPDQSELIAEVVHAVACMKGGSRGRRLTALEELRGWSKTNGFFLETPAELPAGDTTGVE